MHCPAWRRSVRLFEAHPASPSAEPLPSSRRWEGQVTGSKPAALHALTPPQQSTPPLRPDVPHLRRTGPSPLSEQTPPRSPLSCSSPPAPRCPRRAASRWRPVRARPLGWRGALWCDPHQPRSLVLIHLLSFSGLIVVASRPRCPDCNAGASRAGVGGGGRWSAWGARPLLGCPLPRLPNDRRDLPRLWCTREWQQP